MIILTMSDENADTLCTILAESLFPAHSDETSLARDLFCSISDLLDEDDEGVALGGGDPGFLEDVEYCAICGERLN